MESRTAAGEPGRGAPLSPSLALDSYVPALCTLVAGLLVLALRPAIPIDETRYLEVLREMDGRSPLLLHLNSEPYAHKPPLLFWCGRVLAFLTGNDALGLRVLPALFAAGSVLLVARMGRYLKTPGAGWLQATMLLPFAYSQVLYFDSLLAFSVALCLAAWLEGRDKLAALGCALALLAKGPVALIPLVALLIATRDFRAGSRAGFGRVAAVVAAGLAALVAWALSAAWLGGDAFAEELLFKQTAGRIAGASPHPRPWHFYVTAAPLAFAPWALALFSARAVWRQPAQRALALGALAALIVYSLPTSKQPAYILPLAPVFALLAAGALRSDPRFLAVARGASALVQLLLAGALAWCMATLPELVEKYGFYGERLVANGGFRTALIACASALLVGAFYTLSRRPRLTGTAATLLFGLTLAFSVVHAAAGRLVIPEHLAAELASLPHRPLACLGDNQGRYLNYLTRRDRVEQLESDTVAAWCEAHPGAFLVVEDAIDEALVGLPLRAVLSDVSRGHGFTLYEVESPSSR